MCNLFVILKTVGDWEDTYTTAEYVCLTLSEAEAKVRELDSIYNNCKVTHEQWEHYKNQVYDYEDEHDTEFDSIVEGVVYLNPELKDDIDHLIIAEEIYEGLDGIPWYHIKEVPLIGDNIPETLINAINGNNN